MNHREELVTEDTATSGGGSYERPLAPPPRREAGTRLAVVAFAIGGALILALGLWLGSRPPAVAIPQLEIVEPAAGEHVAAPVTLIFDVQNARIRIGPGGWGYGSMHLHAYIGGREIMPGPNDIEFVGSPARYQWVLPGVPAGEHVLQIGWSDLRHERIAEGESETVSITVR